MLHQSTPTRAALMRIQAHFPLMAVTAAIFALPAAAQQAAKPADTEVWTPVPRVVTPGATDRDPPSDAIRLFDGKNLDEWVLTKDKSAARWKVGDGVITVD